MRLVYCPCSHACAVVVFRASVGRGAWGMGPRRGGPVTPCQQTLGFDQRDISYPH